MLEIIVQGLLKALALLLAFALFGVGAVAAWKWFMPGELWEFVEEDDISQHFELLRKHYLSPLWRLVTPKRSRVALGLSDCRASVCTINEKLRADHSHLSDREAQHDSVHERVERLKSELEALKGASERLREMWHDAGDKLSAELIHRGYDAYQQHLHRERDEAKRYARALRADVRKLIEALALRGIEMPAEADAFFDGRVADREESGPKIPGRVSRLSEALGQGLSSSAEARREIAECQEAASHLVEWTSEILVPLFDRKLDKQQEDARVLLALGDAHFDVVSPTRGEQSDGHYHEEIAQGAPTDDCPPGHVIRTVERGYIWRGIVLRKAKVVVAAQTPQRRENSQEA